MLRLTSRPLFHDWKAQNRETNANFEAFRGHFSIFLMVFLRVCFDFASISGAAQGAEVPAGGLGRLQR